MSLFKRKIKKVIEEEIQVPTEYRIREVHFDDDRIEYFAEAKYHENQKYGIEWSPLSTQQIMFNKGHSTFQEAEAAIEKRKKRDLNPSGIVNEVIHSK